MSILRAYGATDMRLSSRGDYVSLEINPTGQWGFVERAIGQPIVTGDGTPDAATACTVDLHRFCDELTATKSATLHSKEGCLCGSASRSAPRSPTPRALLEFERG